MPHKLYFFHTSVLRRISTFILSNRRSWQVCTYARCITRWSTAFSTFLKLSAIVKAAASAGKHVHPIHNNKRKVRVFFIGMFIQVCNIRGNPGVRFAYNRLQIYQNTQIYKKKLQKKRKPHLPIYSLSDDIHHCLTVFCK